MTVEKEKVWFFFSTNPFNKEHVQFSLDSRRMEVGQMPDIQWIFSIFSHLNWYKSLKFFQAR